MPFDGSRPECAGNAGTTLPSASAGTQRRRLLALTGGFSLAALVIAATLAKAAVFAPVLPHHAGPSICLCGHSPTPAEDKAFVEQAMRAAVIPARR